VVFFYIFYVCLLVVVARADALDRYREGTNTGHLTEIEDVNNPEMPLREFLFFNARAQERQKRSEYREEAGDIYFLERNKTTGVRVEEKKRIRN